MMNQLKTFLKEQKLNLQSLLGGLFFYGLAPMNVTIIKPFPLQDYAVIGIKLFYLYTLYLMAKFIIALFLKSVDKSTN